MSKETATCETCGSCVYIGEGDFICDRRKDPELVIIDWQAEREACEKYPRLFDHAAQGGQMVQLNMIDAFKQRMRELGIDGV